jgi:dTDP-4-dehydrorhamnose 3,5-epimerase
MSRFKIHHTSISGLTIIERKQISDERGFLTRIYCQEELAAVGWRKSVVQINYTKTNSIGTVRGMHYQQPPFAEYKLVTCLRGAVWDVSLDVRANSTTFLQWHGEELSSSNRRSVLIPEGFAHGFQALTDDVELLYLHSMEYTPNAEVGLNPKDPKLSICWPLAVTQLSTRDANHPLLVNQFKGIVL